MSENGREFKNQRQISGIESIARFAETTNRSIYLVGSYSLPLLFPSVFETPTPFKGSAEQYERDLDFCASQEDRTALENYVSDKDLPFVDFIFSDGEIDFENNKIKYKDIEVDLPEGALSPVYHRVGDTQVATFNPVVQWKLPFLYGYLRPKDAKVYKRIEEYMNSQELTELDQQIIQRFDYLYSQRAQMYKQERLLKIPKYAYNLLPENVRQPLTPITVGFMKALEKYAGISIQNNRTPKRKKED